MVEMETYPLGRNSDLELYHGDTDSRVIQRYNLSTQLRYFLYSTATRAGWSLLLENDVPDDSEKIYRRRNDVSIFIQCIMRAVWDMFESVGCGEMRGLPNPF